MPEAVLWLVGGPSDRVRARCKGRDDIRLFGRLPPGEVLAHVANFDVGLYSRRVVLGPAAVKIAEYLGMGVPVVGYDLDVMELVQEKGAGLVATDGREFVAAVVGLAADPVRRRELGARAAEAGREHDWDRLLERYRREVLDVHLPPGIAREA